ncbi:hypothetical protein [Teredinibacter haidensis]|uniref:hypothetical protein n=1 Tax=Teredinibacter haidensis TaxID=2731755 RepID=UPI000A6626AF|nr:hypothetical protein [Teredinibacter haidensis]
MTTYSDAIISLLSYSATDLHVSSADEVRIIRLIRSDPNLGATVYNLDRKGYLNALFTRRNKWGQA